jgi:hypothetical protein
MISPAPATTAPTASPPPLPACLEALPVVHRRRRIELRYLLTRERAAALLHDLVLFLDDDPHGGSYPVTTVYYDTPALECYREKIDRLRYRRFRRKLRLRHYQGPGELTEPSPVFVELKQWSEGVVEKRRISLPWTAATRLCRGGRVEVNPARHPFAQEVAALVGEWDLRPAAVVTYRRRALVGTFRDPGLRITLDSDLRYRLAEWSHSEAERPLIDPGQAILEVKADCHLPPWATLFIRAHQGLPVCISKYCQSIEAAGRAPRSVLHVPDPQDPADRRPW